MSVVSQLELIRDQILANMVEITANPMPSYSDGDRSLSMTEYLAELQKQVDALTATINGQKPYWIETKEVY